MDDNSKFNLADTRVLDEGSVERSDSPGLSGNRRDLDDEDLAETFVLDDAAIQKAEDMGMTGILKDLDDEADDDPDDEGPAWTSNSGYTIELSLDDDD